MVVLASQRLAGLSVASAVRAVITVKLAIIYDHIAIRFTIILKLDYIAIFESSEKPLIRLVYIDNYAVVIKVLLPVHSC